MSRVAFSQPHLLFTIATVLCTAGCGDDTSDPLSSKERQLKGEWILPLAEVDQDDLQFSYRFDSGGAVRNRIGGAFLKSLRELDEAADVDLGELSNVDGGYVNWLGNWSVSADSLQLNFSSLTIELFGEVPIVGRVTIPVYQQDFDASEAPALLFTCELMTDQLTLRGESLTAGIPLDPDVPGSPTPELSPLGTAAITLVGDFLIDFIRQESLDEFLFARK